MRRGFTLIELIVAITIFVTVVTLSLGGFIAIAHLKTQVGDMKETQQKLRLITEMLYRDIKDGSSVTTESTASEGDLIRIDYSVGGVTTDEKVFELTPLDGPYSSFMYYDCAVTPTGYRPGGNFLSSADCTSGDDLLSKEIGTSFTLSKIGSKPIFKTNWTIPETIEVAFNLTNSPSGDSLLYDNLVILENAR